MLESSNLLFQIHSTFSLIREGRCSRVNDVEGNLQAPKNKLEMLARGFSSSCCWCYRNRCESYKYFLFQIQKSKSDGLTFKHLSIKCLKVQIYSFKFIPHFRSSVKGGVPETMMYRITPKLQQSTFRE